MTGVERARTAALAVARVHATAWTCLYAERLPRHRDGAAAMLASWG